MASTGDTWRLGRRPALDGLRGIAVLLVVLCHTGIPGFEAEGAIGVTIFFALSGFLITALLLEEHGSSGRISFGRFYVRRARRLFPALLAMLAVTGAFMSALGMSVRPVPVLAYYGNWVQALGGGTVDLGVWAHTWSLAVEEQFYLVWPVVLVALVSRWGRRGVLFACAVGAAWSVVGRVVAWVTVDAQRAYYGTDMRLDGLLLGAALAALLVGLQRRLPSVPTVPAVVALFCLGLTDGLGLLTFAIVPAVSAPLSVALVASIVQDAAPRWLEWRPLTLVGRRSYGLYLWHLPLAWIGGKFAPLLDVPRFVVPVVVLLLAAACTEASWRLVEQPVMRAGRSAATVQPERRADDELPIQDGQAQAVDRAGLVFPVTIEPVPAHVAG